MLNQFRSRYPQGSLLTELLCIDHGLYIVRCWIQTEGTTLATGLAAAQSIELAEDRARNRALSLLGLEMTTASHPEETPTPSGGIPKQAPTLSSEDFRQTQSTQLSDTAKTDVAQSPSTVELTIPDTSLDDDYTSLVADQTTFTDELADAKVESHQKFQPPRMSPQQVSKGFSQEELLQDEVNRDLSQDIIEQPSQDIPIDFSDIIARTSVELKRLGWTNQQGRDYLLQTYGKRSRQLLTDQELLDFLRNLESLPTPD
ncbi:MAG: hypothetical protein F6K36_23165 [Symploca sp. SIO3C6]|uniref:Uncharacterized protein n=1 Tax=Symploca sp. SIO1C4 TaxID=2607765 RepID=A0A6B3NB82_9CYAN|nr:hypothetical protein [Symploca sp. SIO3C6]NER28840.1 hypothetical protein [Symploca sp. SIO1C4]NET05201.1 hypothetical protein [Symploca sp. SIO2B6]